MEFALNLHNIIQGESVRNVCEFARIMSTERFPLKIISYCYMYILACIHMTNTYAQKTWQSLNTTKLKHSYTEHAAHTVNNLERQILT